MLTMEADENWRITAARERKRHTVNWLVWRQQGIRFMHVKFFILHTNRDITNSYKLWNNERKKKIDVILLEKYH